MSGTAVVLAGDEEAGAALGAALRERGIEARFHGSSGLAPDLVDLEADLTEQGPNAAVAAGSGQGALALAITASKLGVPSWRFKTRPRRSDTRGAHHRDTGDARRGLRPRSGRGVHCHLA